MSAAASIGRIGALAVALGIGAAVTTGTGVAWAAPDGSAGDKDTSAQAGSTDTAKDTAKRADGPLSKIADRVRKNIEEGKAKALKRPKLGSTTPVSAKPENATDLEETAAATTRKPRTALRDRLDDAATQATVRRNATADIKPEPVSALPDLTPKAATKSVVVNVEATINDAAATVDDTVRRLRTDTVTTEAPAPAVARAEKSVPKLMSSVLAAAGVAPLAGTNPSAPAQPPALLALVAWARREWERTLTPTAQLQSVADVTPAAALVVDPNLQTPQPAKPVVGQTTGLGWVTGPGITDKLPAGTPGAYGINGTDLGIMWDDGAGHVLMLFGDTFDQPGMTGVWRSNVLLRTVDTNLNNGLSIQDAVISPGGNYDLNEWSNEYGATQVIRDPGFLGLFGSTTTIIPTAAISVTDENGNTTQYANVMSVRTWDTPGRWTTNWSAIAYSTDGGQHWTVDPDTVRSSGWLRASTRYVPGDVNFQQGAFVQGPETDVDPNGVQYVYSFGTPSGRGGSAYVARVPEDQIRDLSAYEYWAGDEQGWVADDPSAAVPVIGATNKTQPTGFIGRITKAINDFLGGIVVGGLTGGNVSEMSVQYNEYLGKYVVLYTDGGNNVVMRVSDSPQGVWSEPTTLIANNPLGSNTGMYAPMIHPWSGTDKLGEDNEQYLYYNVSYWGPYNVQLMRTDLSPMASQSSTITV